MSGPGRPADQGPAPVAVPDPPSGPGAHREPDRRDRAPRPAPAPRPRPAPDEPAAGPEPVAPGRFAQLTYTSVDARDGRGGGWQIHRTSGDPTDDEQRFLVSRISTHFGAEAADTGYLTAAQVAGLPRRLVHGPVQPGTATALWHTAPAGADASGRPGNVFAHVLLDRAPEARTPSVRPSDALGSPCWLRPHGADQVLAATLDTVPEPPWEPGPAAGHESVVQFLADAAVRRSTVLAALLDAVAAAMHAGGPIVAFVAESPARAEQWIAAISCLMSPGTARRFFWSTRETRAGLAGARSRGTHLAVVGDRDADELARDPGFIVIRDVPDQGEDEPAAVTGSLSGGEPHQTRDGASIRVTAWSSLAAEVFSLDAGSAAGVLERIEVIAARLDDRRLSCSWPLAAVVSLLPGEFGEDAQEAAATVLTGPAPPGLRHYPELVDTIHTMLDAAVGRTPQEALDYANSQDQPGVVDRRRARGIYVERALLDWDWLTRPEPLPSLGFEPPDLAENLPWVARKAVDLRAGLRASADPDGVVAAVGVLRLIQLVRFYRIPDPGVGLEESLAELTQRVVAPTLLDPVYGPEIIEWVGPSDDEQAQRVVRDAVNRILPGSPRRPGERLWPSVLRWLHVIPPVPPSPAELRSSFASVPQTTLELALQAHGVVADPSEFRLVALGHELAVGAPEPGPPRLAAAHRWTTADLRAMTGSFPVEPVADELRAWVLRLPFDEDLAAATNDIEATTARHTAGTGRQHLLDAARFRITAYHWTSGAVDPGGRDSLDRFLYAAERVLQTCVPEELAPETVVALQAASVVDVVRNGAPSRPAVAREMSRTELLSAPPAVVTQVHDALRRGLVSEAATVGAALVMRAQTTVPELAHLDGLAALTVGPSGPPVLGQVMYERLTRRGGPGAQALLDDAFRGMETNIEARLGRRASGVLDAVEHEMNAVRRDLRVPGAGDENRSRWRWH